MFQIKEGAYDTESLIEFLADLHAHVGGDKVTLIRDGLPSHKSGRMKAWLATQRHWLVVEQLPPYAHDLNPSRAAMLPVSWLTARPAPQ